MRQPSTHYNFLWLRISEKKLRELRTKNDNFIAEAEPLIAEAEGLIAEAEGLIAEAEHLIAEVQCI